MRLVIIACIGFLLSYFLFTDDLHASLIGVDTLKGLGKVSNEAVQIIINSANSKTDAVMKITAYSTYALLVTVYIIFVIYTVTKLIVQGNGMLGLVKFVLPSFFLFSIISFLLLNISFITKYLQIPLLQIYKSFGGAVLGYNGNALITDIANKCTTVFDALNQNTGSILTNAGGVILSLFVLFLMFLIFLHIVLLLVKNYIKIILPFAFSPILLIAFVFPTFRALPMKALNIVLDGILKQGSLMFVIAVMTDVFSFSVKMVASEAGGTGMITVLIIAFVYKDLLQTAEQFSSEIMGTQSLSPVASNIGMAASFGAGMFGARMATKFAKLGWKGYKNKGAIGALAKKIGGGVSYWGSRI